MCLDCLRGEEAKTAAAVAARQGMRVAVRNLPVRLDQNIKSPNSTATTIIHRKSLCLSDDCLSLSQCAMGHPDCALSGSLTSSSTPVFAICLNIAIGSIHTSIDSICSRSLTAATSTPWISIMPPCALILTFSPFLSSKSVKQLAFNSYPRWRYQENKRAY